MVPRTAADAGGWLEMSPLPVTTKITLFAKVSASLGGESTVSMRKSEICIFALPVPTPHRSAKITIIGGAQKAEGLCLLQY